MDGIKGKRVIITGGAAGIGFAIARLLAASGAVVGIVDSDADAIARARVDLEKVASEVHSVRCDVSSMACVTERMTGLAEDMGQVGALVNNAGILRIGGLLEIDEGDWRDTFRVNVDGTFFACRAVVPRMVAQGEGCVVNISSWMGKCGAPGYAAYSASKFAVVSMTQALALEIAESGVRVNAVCPGIVAQTQMRNDADSFNRKRGMPNAEDRIESVPMRRLGTPSDVAEAVAFLVSDHSRYMTGETLNVSGGLWRH